MASVKSWSFRYLDRESAAGADSYLVTNHNFYPGVDPFTVASMGPIAIMPSEVSLQEWSDGMGHSVETADDIDPAVDGWRSSSFSGARWCPSRAIRQCKQRSLAPSRSSPPSSAMARSQRAS
jgi:hypothetical protein